MTACVQALTEAERLVERVDVVDRTAGCSGTSWCICTNWTSSALLLPCGRRYGRLGGALPDDVLSVLRGRGAEMPVADDSAQPVPLRRLLEELGWSREQLISHVNGYRRQRGLYPLNPKAAYPWTRGKRPLDGNIDDVVAVLSRHAGRPITAEDLGWGKQRPRPRTRARALDDPYNARAVDLIRETQGETPMDRRSFGLLGGAAVTGVALDLLITGTPAMAAAVDGDRVSPKLLEVIETTVRKTRELDDAEGSTSVLSWANGTWKNLGQVLTESRYTGQTEIRLQTAYIEMAEQYGWMLFDASHHPQAQRVFQTGLRLAHEAQDARAVRRATANLLASSAYQATWLGQHTEAATMLRVAEHRADGDLTPGLNAILTSRKMSLAGATGNRAALPGLEDEIRDSLSGIGDDEPWWTLWQTEDMVDQQTGRAWLAAGDPDVATPYLQRSNSYTDSPFSRERMLRATELADAFIKTGDVNGATRAATTALALATDVGSPRVREQLGTVTSRLVRRYPSHAAVTELMNRFPEAS